MLVAGLGNGGVGVKSKLPLSSFFLLAHTHRHLLIVLFAHCDGGGQSLCERSTVVTFTPQLSRQKLTMAPRGIELFKEPK